MFICTFCLLAKVRVLGCIHTCIVTFSPPNQPAALIIGNFLKNVYLQIVKYFLLCLFLLVSSFTWSQTTYTSPFTQSFPSGLIEEITRSITISDEEITIITDTSEGKDIQSLIIQTRLKNDEGDPIFVCTSKDGRVLTTALLQTNDPPSLDLIQSDPDDPETQLHYRFLLD
jgi:hypothetical protein